MGTRTFEIFDSNNANHYKLDDPNKGLIILNEKSAGDGSATFNTNIALNDQGARAWTNETNDNMSGYVCDNDDYTWIFVLVLKEDLKDFKETQKGEKYANYIDNFSTERLEKHALFLFYTVINKKTKGPEDGTGVAGGN